MTAGGALPAPRGGHQRRAAGLRRRIVAASFVVLSIGGLTSNSFALFLVIVPEDLGWSRSATTLAYGIYALTAAVTAPLIGWAVSNYDSRLVYTVASVVSAVGFAGCALMHSVVEFWLFFGLLGGLGSHGFSSFALFTVIGTRFSKGAATAMSVADAGAGLALFLGLPALHVLIIAAGWRSAYLAMAVLCLVIGVGFHILTLPAVRRRQPPVPQVPGTAGPPRQIWPLILMLAAFVCGPAAYQALQTQQIALLEGSGVASSTAVWVASTIGGAVFIWRVLAGVLCDRIGVRWTMGIAAGAAVLALAALGLLIATGVQSVLFVYPVALAFGFGSQAMLMAMGLRGIVPGPAFPRAFGVMRTGFGAGGFIGPVVAAVLFDATDSYELAVIVIAVLAFIHFAGFSFATREAAAVSSPGSTSPARR